MAGQFTTVGIELVVRRMANFQKATQTIRRQIGITGVQANRMSKQFRSASSVISGFGNSIRNAGNQVLILGFQLTFLASGAMAAFISKAVDFEKSMVKIITLVGVAEGRVAQWADQLLDIAPALGKSPVELAEALFVITSAGIRDQAEAIDVLTQSAKAASIGLGETEAVARVITGAMQAYEDVNLTAAEAVDILVATIREGNIEVESLAPTLGRVIATAANMGVSFAEVGAFIATFSRTAVPAEVAVTSLRAALNAILKPTAGAEEKLAEYNITMQDVWESIKNPERGLHDTLLALSLVFGDNNEEMAEVIGSARGLAGIFTVTGGLAEEYVEIFREIAESAGITDEAFDRFIETTAFMGASAKASFDSLAITIGATLLPGLNALLAAISPVFDSIRELAELHPKVTIFVGALAGIVTIIGPLLIISGLLVSSLGTLVIAIGSFAGFIVSLLSPLALVAAAIAALFAGMALAIGISLGDAQEKLDAKGKSLTTRAWEWGKNIILAFAKGMGAAARAITEVLILIGNHIRDLLKALSPPKLLPDIGKWGQKTMEEWIEGWLLADFGKFKDIAGLVESAIRSLTFDSDLLGGLSEEEGLEAIIKSRTGIAGVIEEIRELGEVTQETLDKVFDPSIVGKSSDALKEYVLAMLDLDEATKELTDSQKELNDAEEHFKNILDPLNDQLEKTRTEFKNILDPLNDQLEKTRTEFKKVLKELNDELDRTKDSYSGILSPIDEEIQALEDRRQAILDQREKEELLAIISDVNAPALAKEVAQMRLRHMELILQKKATEDERDTAVDAVQQKIDAEEEIRDKKLESLQEQINAEEELRDKKLESLQEQINAEEELRDKEIEHLQASVDAAQTRFDIANDIVKTIEEQIRIQIENNELVKEYVQLLEQSKKKTKGLTDAVGDLADVLGGGLDPFGGGGAGADGEGEEDEGGGLFEDLQKDIDQLVLDVQALIAESKAAFLEGYGDTKLIEDLADVWSDVIVGAAEKLDSSGLIPVVGAFLRGAIEGSIEYALKEPDRDGGEGGIFWPLLEKVLFGDTTPTIGERVIELFTGYFQNVIDIIKALWVIIIDQNGPLGEWMLKEVLNRTTAGSVAVDIWEFFSGTQGDISPIDQSEIFLEWQEGIKGTTDALVGTGIHGSPSLDKAVNTVKESTIAAEEKAALLKKVYSDQLTPAIVDRLTPAFDSGLVPAIHESSNQFIKQSVAVDKEVVPKLVTLKDYITNELEPTIGTKLVGAVVDIKDKFIEWKDVVKRKAQKALETLEEFLGIDFSETISSVSEFLGIDFSETISSVSEFLDETFSPAVEWLEEVWTNLKNALAGPLTDAFNEFEIHVLNPIATAVDNVKGAIDGLMGKIAWLLEKLPFIKVPDALAEDSPSPMESAIRNVMAAMDEMANESAPLLAASMRGELGSVMAQGTRRNGRMAVMPMQHGGSVNHREMTMNMGGQTINNGMDAAKFSQLVERAMKRAM